MFLQPDLSVLPNTATAGESLHSRDFQQRGAYICTVVSQQDANREEES